MAMEENNMDKQANRSECMIPVNSLEDIFTGHTDFLSELQIKTEWFNTKLEMFCVQFSFSTHSVIL